MKLISQGLYQLDRLMHARGKPKPRPVPGYKKRTRLPKVERIDGESFFSMTQVAGENGVAALISPDGLEKRSIAYLSYDKFSSRTGYTLNLSDVFDKRMNCHKAVFMIRKSPITSAVNNVDARIKHALNQAPPGGESEKLLTDYQRWSLGTGEGRHAYELLIVTRHDSMVGKERTSALYGRLVKDTELGPFIHDWNLTLPITWRSQEGIKQLDYAAPQTIWWNPKTYFTIPDAMKAYAIWLGYLPPGRQKEEWKDLLDTADYVIIHAEVHGNPEEPEVWANIMAVVTRPWKEDGETPDFSDASRTLAKLKLDRATEDRLYEAMRCIAPCSFSPPVRPEYVPDAHLIFGDPGIREYQDEFPTAPYLTSRLVPFSQEDGDFALGLIRGKTPAILKKFGDDSPNMGVLGATGEGGKTTIFGYFAFVASILANYKARINTGATPLLMWLPLSKVVDSAVEAAIRRWPGHKLKDLSYLEDAATILSRQRKPGEVITKKHVEDLQHELHTQDQLDAYGYADWLLDEALKHGRPMHYPHGFTYTEDFNHRMRNWMDAFLERHLGNWAQLYHLWRVRQILVADDFHALDVGPDTNLGDWAIGIAKALGSRIDICLTQGKNKGFHTWVLSQAKGDLDIGSAYHHLNTVVNLSMNDQGIRVGSIIKPNLQPNQPDTVHFDEAEYVLEEYALGLCGHPEGM